MRHEQVTEQLSDYIEGALDSAMAAAVENHLRECDACRAEETSLRAVFRALDNPAMNIAPPPMFHADVMRRIRLQQGGAADKRGFLERIGWAWTAAGSLAAAAVLALAVVTVGPLSHGMKGGLAPSLPGMQTPTTIAVEAPEAPARAGGSVSLGIAAPAGGAWTRTVDVSSGLDVQSPADGASLALAVHPDAAGTVQEALIRFQGKRDGSTQARMVFIPVQTGGRADATVNWRPQPGATLQTVLETAARAYAVTVTAPESALNTPVSLQLDNADAVTALQAICRASGLRYTLHHGA
jgi:anti-sigma factor RsiW